MCAQLDIHVGNQSFCVTVCRCVKKLLEKPPIVAPPRVAATAGDGEDEPDDGRKQDGGGDPGAGSQDDEIVEVAAAPEEITVSFKPEVAVDWTAEDDDSNNALHLAARKGHTAVVRSLLDKDETNLIRARLVSNMYLL